MRIKHILTLTGKIIAGIFLFYLFVCWIIVPVAGPLAIRSQGTKILNTPVKARSVTFNPFLWRLSLKQIEIFDAQRQMIAGFDRLNVDVSFLGLFKKMIRVESLLLDGLKIHAQLLPDGSVNLLSLLPQPAPEAQPEQPPADAPDPSAAQELPLILIDEIALTNGRVQFTDLGVEPNFTTALSEMNLHVTGASTRPDARMKISFQARLDDKGVISSETTLDPFVVPLQMETSFTLDQYVLTILTPYTGKYTGRALADGNLTLKMDYRIADNQITAAHRLLIQRFTFGEKIDSKDALNLPLGLAIALLEDPQGRINISLPVKGDMNDPDFEYLHLVGQVIRNFFVKLVTKPFSFLASVIGAGGSGGTDELGALQFIPGTAELSAEEFEKIRILAEGLKERPKLRLVINGTYDEQADWKAVKTDTFARDFEELQAESTKSNSWVYQQLYHRQFGLRALWKMLKEHKAKGPDDDEAALNEHIREAIIKHGSPDRAALELLAKARAQILYDALIAEGFDPKRMRLGSVRNVQMSMGFVPLEFTFTIFEE